MRKIRLFFALFKENPLHRLFLFFCCNLFRLTKIFRLKIHGISVHVRTGTPDLKVAHSCLGGEFAAISTAFPRNTKGLIVDAGGYIGTAAIALAQMYPDATILSIEPSGKNFEILRKNIAGYKNIHPLNAALTTEGSPSCVSLMDRGTGQWGFTIVGTHIGKSADCFIEKTKTITINQILEQAGQNEIMIFKMDIEGAELALLEKPDWLDKTGILMIELHERIVSGCLKAFDTANRCRYVYREKGEKFISVGKSYFKESS